MLNKTQLLFIIILIEGYVVLACELLVIRLLIPFVGSGTETISIIISAVLLPLAIGYHRGGKAFSNAYAKSKRKNRKRFSIRSLLLRNITSSLIILSFGLSYIFLEAFFEILGMFGVHHKLAQTAIYCGLFLVWPVFLLGQTVPLVSNYFSREHLSEITGKMLFFSTTGSFLGSVFSTIVLMMIVGVHNTVIITMGLLFVVILLLVRRFYAFEVFFGLGVMLLLYAMNSSDIFDEFNIVSNNAYNVVRVVENDEEKYRDILINRSTSSRIAADKENNFSYIKYLNAQFIKPIEKVDSTPKNILIIGAGGFTVGLNDTHNNYTYVDIDPDLKDITEKYFLKEKLSKNKNFIAASARAFLKDHKTKYDFILLDAYTNVYSIPLECTTKEFLEDVKKVLNKDGIIVANIISSPVLGDKFSVRYNNTFASVFPHYTRQVVDSFNGWQKPVDYKENFASQRNALYIYYDNQYVDDNTIYTDNKNSFSTDRQ